MKLSDPVELNLKPRAWVYRLWNADGDCLYVGQHKGFHPAKRINEHRQQPWWNEVSRADYVEVLEGDLDLAEKQQIHDMNALYNDGGWTRLHPRVRVDKPALSVLGPYISLKGAAEQCGISVESIHALLRKGDLPCVRFGPGRRIILIDRDDLEDFRKQHYTDSEVTA